ncbi:MAG: amino acid ABC transporter permease [Hamadaea sp.]|uniref:amino acid ABC transporter permease n=1 Tax=Hamadaea sp. TaxID=2024425 RepID=UPI0017F42A6F|nr:amino acid ABC transporter permease [Hamadaea sp.]NUR72639.1 amino acid ABC transporter permease [Hamadaea sp.]NUT19734.1 amino acid ABC transporter permease [Hamadaea sp.]
MSSVLYDSPGPRTKAMTIIGSVVAVPLIGLAVYLWIYRPLADAGQFKGELWGPIVDPNNQYFSLVWERWGDGWLNTLKAAVLSIIASLLLGSLIALVRRELRELRHRRFPGSPFGGFGRFGVLVGRGLTRAWVEIARGTPVVTTLYFVFLVLPIWGIDFDDRMWFLVIGLTIYNSVVIGEIIRSGMDGLPQGQDEAARAVGLSTWQSSRIVMFPQAFRVMLPALISQVVVILKDTSLGGVIISYEEALGVTKQMVEAFRGEHLAIGIPMYFSIGVIYIVVNYALSKLAAYLQKRLSRRGFKPIDKPATALVAEASAGAGGAGSL